MADPQIVEDHSGAISPQDVELESLVLPTDEQRKDWADILALTKKVNPILQRLIGGAERSDEMHPPSIRIKALEARILVDWIVTLQNIGDLQSQQIETAKAVIGSQAEALAQYESATGKKLWVPGPV